MAGRPNCPARPRSRRCAALAGLCLALAGCAGDAPPTPTPTVSAILDRPAGVIRVTVAGLRPADQVESIRLMGPGGARVAPAQRSRASSVTATQSNPTVGVHARGGSASGIEPGLTLSFDLFDWSWSESQTRPQRRVTARFAIPDGFRARPDAWHVEAVITDPTGAARRRRAPVSDT